MKNTNNYQLPLSTYLLSLAQTINLTMAVLSVSMSALVGLKLAPNLSLGTMPYGLQFAAVMLCTYLASMLMQKKGRAFAFYIACCFLFAAGICGYFAVSLHNFYLLCLAHILLGVYISCANFYRFAATDGLNHDLKAKAISFVVLGGVLAAVLGPFLAQILKNVANMTEFSLCYAVMSFFAILNMLVIFFWQKWPSTLL
jgi:MFS family permease